MALLANNRGPREEQTGIYFMFFFLSGYKHITRIFPPPIHPFTSDMNQSAVT